MNYWWVNQNQTYKVEVQGGFLWSPKVNKDGRRNQFYDNMSLVKPGDVVFHFVIPELKQLALLMDTHKLQRSQTLAHLVIIGTMRAG